MKKVSKRKGNDNCELDKFLWNEHLAKCSFPSRQVVWRAYHIIAWLTSSILSIVYMEPSSSNQIIVLENKGWSKQISTTLNYSTQGQPSESRIVQKHLKRKNHTWEEMKLFRAFFEWNDHGESFSQAHLDESFPRDTAAWYFSHPCKVHTQKLSEHQSHSHNLI